MNNNNSLQDVKNSINELEADRLKRVKDQMFQLDEILYLKLKDQIRESYKNNKHDLHRKLEKEKNFLLMKHNQEAKFTLDQKVRMEGSWGASEWETRKMTYIINFNPLKQYGSFEMYSGDGDYYAEGGLWFHDNELTDYDGIFALPSEIYEQLHKWDLKTDHEGGA